jgi:hypothetical protein
LPAGLSGFDLTDDETDLRAVFEPSYEALCESAASLFRLLGGQPDRPAGDPLDEAESLRLLGGVRRGLGDPSGAEEALSAALSRYERLGYAEAEQVLAELDRLRRITVLVQQCVEPL